jgi:hypothetical protein
MNARSEFVSYHSASLKRRGIESYSLITLWRAMHIIRIQGQQRSWLLLRHTIKPGWANYRKILIITRTEGNTSHSREITGNYREVLLSALIIGSTGCRSLVVMLSLSIREVVSSSSARAGRVKPMAFKIGSGCSFAKSTAFRSNWLIDYLLFYVPLKNISLIWRRH